MENTESRSKAPVALFAYRKAEFLEEIFEAIIRYSPPKLYLFQDYAKSKYEQELVNTVRKKILKTNFPFETEFIFQEKHLGTFNYFCPSLDYVFSKEEQLIVLEDDIIPADSFFTFCNDMLALYSDNEKIGCINGCNLNAVNQQNSHYFSGICLPFWGWATWKKKWEMNNDQRSTNNWQEYKGKIRAQITQKNRAFFSEAFDRYAIENIPWDINWNWVLLANDQKCVLPGINLITNKGFVPHGTYTNYVNSNFSNLVQSEFTGNEYDLITDAEKIVNYEDYVARLYKEVIDRHEMNYADSLAIRPWFVRFYVKIQKMMNRKK